MNLSAINKATANKTRKSGISPFNELDINKVYPNPQQPRKEFDEVLLQELALDIIENGLLQPIIVTKREAGYMIVGGERRYRATKEFTTLKTIQAHIIDVDDAKVLELALIENIQREDLTDFEVAVHIGKLWSSEKYESKGLLAAALGKKQAYISKAFSALKLDESITTDILEAKHDIGLSVLDEIARVKDKGMQREVYKKYLSKELTREGIVAHRDAESKEGFEKRMQMQSKKPRILDQDTFTKEQFLKYFTKNKAEYLQDGKTYKITIEEIRDD